MIKHNEAYSLLAKEYSYPKISLNYSNPLELLISVMLSAQCTDIRVNIVTKELFKRFKTAKDYATCEIDELKKYVKSTGFYNAKAKHIQETCRIIVEKHNGAVPKTMAELLMLPGVARKTANIVLSNAFGVNDGIAVDTHVKRLSFRLGLTKNMAPEKIEKDLMELYPKDHWNKITYVLIEHGRAVCKAPNPSCTKCSLERECPKLGVTKSK
ncbi:MAG: endonuclease III [Candidatus Woesearchaeota archaeon]|nr:endonuclease III [Candidatus Woesearchaeota archaeon]